jgi:cardiolipin synthase (CMP-forming)
VKQLPNLISVARIPLAALFIFMDSMGARLAIVAIAGVSDWADGRLARATGNVSSTGIWLDPVADKIFVVASVVTLTFDVGLPLWVLPVILLRDLGVLLGALYLAALGRRKGSPARTAGKWVTWLQFVALGVILLRPSFAIWIAPAVGLVGAFALRDYARAVLRRQPREA